MALLLRGGEEGLATKKKELIKILFVPNQKHNIFYFKVLFFFGGGSDIFGYPGTKRLNMALKRLKRGEKKFRRPLSSMGGGIKA